MGDKPASAITMRNTFLSLSVLVAVLALIAAIGANKYTDTYGVAIDALKGYPVLGVAIASARKFSTASVPNPPASVAPGCQCGVRHAINRALYCTILCMLIGLNAALSSATGRLSGDRRWRLPAARHRARLL
jgi:hypothetical protein